MKAKLYSLMLVSTIAFLGCQGGSGEDVVSFPVSYETVSQLNSTEKNTKSVEIFRDTYTFEEEYFHILPSNTFEAIDFKERTVIAANTAKGYEVAIDDIKEYRHCIEVCIKTKTMSSTCQNSAKINTAHIISIPSLDNKDIVIKEEEIMTTCSDDGNIQANSEYSCDTQENKTGDIVFDIIAADTVSPNITGHKLFQTFTENDDTFAQLYLQTTGQSTVPEFTGTMILLRSGFKSTGGFAIEVKSIEAFEEFIKVNVVSTSPGANCLVTMELTNPYVFVNIPNQTYENIIFCETQEITECEEVR